MSSLELAAPPAPLAPAEGEAKSLGAGRSGEVFRVSTRDGEIARKVFGSDTLATLVHTLVYGAPNAYEWSRDALFCAFYRRRVLTALVEVWFGERVIVSNAIAADWDADRRTNVLDAQLVDGRPVRLRTPFSLAGRGEYRVLVHEVMEPLQTHLLESGFDGLAWQAGKGNPVALNNFLVLADKDERPDPGTVRFGWIDLESGVPALFPANPLQLISFYLPAILKHGRAMFDDCDETRLLAYLEEKRGAIGSKLGIQRARELEENVAALVHHQREWKKKKRVESGVEARFLKGRISAARAQRFQSNPLLWYSHEFFRLLPKAAKKLFVKAPLRVWSWFGSLNPRALMANSWAFVSSQEERERFARDYVEQRIADWRERGLLSHDESELLYRELGDDHSSAYLGDFGVHLGMKGAITAFEYLVLPILFVTRVLRPAQIALLFVLDGPLFRFPYVLWRTITGTVKREPIPWVALWFCLIPTIGTLAYPMQMIFAANKGQDQGEGSGQLARFIVVHMFTSFGARIPIWGGKDTRTEHFFNRFALKLARLREESEDKTNGQPRDQSTSPTPPRHEKMQV